MSALFEYVLRLGDNCLIVSQRLSEICGHGPVLEEDIAITNTALDLLGHARFWLSYAGEIEGVGRDEDKLAFMRDAGDFRNVLLVEQPNGDYATTIARQFFFDAWYFHLLRGLQTSTDKRVASIAEKAFKEVTYHLERSKDWMIRMGDGTDESHRRVQAGVDDLWMYTGELFDTDEIDREIVQSGIGVDLANVHPLWTEYITKTFAEATIEIPNGKWMQRGGKHGLHTENLGYLLAEMQFLQRAYPGAQW
jgi:ring-1,2-phenylacetyl-CoA epoxidase subunit PaaC